MFYTSEKWLWVPFYLFFFYLVWKKYKKQTWVIIIAVAILITLTDQVHLHLFKNMFERFRPTHDPTIQDFVHTVNNYRGGEFGFVSGHAANSFAIATFLSVLIGVKYRYFTPLVIFWAALIAYSRIYLGVHFPADIICGAILGSVFGIIMALICKYIIDNINTRKAN